MQRNKKLLNAGAFCLGILLCGLLVQGAGWLKGDRLVFPGVGEILHAFFRLLGQEKTWRQILTTLLHLAQALAVSAVAGTALGMVQGSSPFLRTLLRPLMSLLRSIPMIVMTVIIMVLTRYERVPLIATSLMLLPLVSEAACEGLLRIEPELKDVYRMNSGFSLRVLRLVHLPLMAGYLKQAYVNAVGMGIKLAVTTEYLVQARDSLGKAVYSSAYFNEYAEIYAYALVMILLFVLILTVIKAYDTLEVELSAPEVYTVEGDTILIPTEAVNDGHLHRFEYTTERNVTIRWIVVKKPNSASFGVGFDACEVCGNAGYYERGSQVVCKRCDVVMNTNTIGFKGGCNPIPLAYEVNGGNLVFRLEDLLAGEKEFR